VAAQKRDPKKDPKAVLGEALRQLRTAAGFTQAAAAARIDGWGEDSLQKAETGNQVPVSDFYDRLLKLYQATPRERLVLDVLLDHARTADPVIPEFAEPWLDAERVAALLRVWALFVMPGLLQTLAYAKAMFMMGGSGEEQATAKAQARVKRRRILDAPEAPRLTVLLHRSLLDCLVGSPEVMVGQLENLLELSRRPNIVLQVVTETAYFPGMRGQFAIASGRGIPDTLNMITLEDQTTTAPAMVDGAIMLFEEIRGYALSATESRALIQEALQRWKSQQ
jgi:transcriptional regulator with XRE-family HTH domain